MAEPSLESDVEGRFCWFEKLPYELQIHVVSNPKLDFSQCSESGLLRRLESSHTRKTLNIMPQMATVDHECRSGNWLKIINSNVMGHGRRRATASGMPVMASVCRLGREVVLRHGAWLMTPMSARSMFFIPDHSILHSASGFELTVTENQVMTSLDPVLMRLAIRYNALDQLGHINILISDGEPRMMRRKLVTSLGARFLAEVETCNDTYVGELDWLRMRNEKKHHHTHIE
ncbi:hypothetical protein F4802DRAFT_594111 [Xylaria palmicola]|nr:hypothetical protein F4802DRAFT_594111 [Xylaria palmicola]